MYTPAQARHVFSESVLNRKKSETRRIGIACVITATCLFGAASAIGIAAPRQDSTLKHIDQSALQKVVCDAAHEMLIPGAMVVLRTPQGNFNVACGTTLLGTVTAPTAGTYFRIASNTKTMTAALILQLAQENKLRLDDPVSKYVAGVPNGDHITIAELLEMRSGLYNYTNAPAVAASIDHEPSKAWTPAELLTLAFAHPSNAPPGTTYEYSNTNYVLLGLIVEKLDAKPLAQSMHDRLFAPLHLEHTFLPAAAESEMPAPFSHGYLYGSSSLALVGDIPYTAEDKAAARAGTLLPRDYTNVNHSFATAAGGVISTASDVATWIEALVSGRVLDAAWQQRWLDGVQPENPAKPAGQKYGYGIAQIAWGPNTLYFHGGETAGFNSFMGYDPRNKFTLVVWSNLTVSLDDQPTANVLMLKILDQIYTDSPLTPTAPATNTP